LVILDSTISGNTAEQGGGISILWSHKSDASITIVGSTISGNTALNLGGGISNEAAMSDVPIMTIRDSTISDNTAVQGTGGGLYNSCSAAITGTTISGNSATWGGHKQRGR